MSKYEFWFVVGSQFLYGPEVLETVAVRAEEMAREIGVCTATFYNRLANPGKFQLEEVLKLCRRLGFPIEKTRSLLRYV